MMDGDDGFVLTAAMAGDTTFEWMASSSCSSAAAMASSIYSARKSEEERRRRWESTLEYGTSAPPPSPNAAANFERGMRQMAAYQERTRTRARRRPWYWGRPSRGR